MYLHLSIVTTQGDFSESLNNAILLDMDNGSQISLMGDNASNIQLSFANTNGFTTPMISLPMTGAPSMPMG